MSDISRFIALGEGYGRHERLELPEDALREALVNAIAHRDYRSSANVQMYLFRDRLEIVTPGGLPAGMREEDLGIRSVPRNRLLFGMFHRMGMVEQIGSGIRRIRQECRDYGVAEPLIEVSETRCGPWNERRAISSHWRHDDGTVRSVAAQRFAA